MTGGTSRAACGKDARSHAGPSPVERVLREGYRRGSRQDHANPSSTRVRPGRPHEMGIMGWPWTHREYPSPSRQYHRTRLKETAKAVNVLLQLVNHCAHVKPCAIDSLETSSKPRPRHSLKLLTTTTGNSHIGCFPNSEHGLNHGIATSRDAYTGATAHSLHHRACDRAAQQAAEVHCGRS